MFLYTIWIYNKQNNGDIYYLPDLSRAHPLCSRPATARARTTQRNAFRTPRRPRTNHPPPAPDGEKKKCQCGGGVLTCAISFLPAICSLRTSAWPAAIWAIRRRRLGTPVPRSTRSD